MGELLGSLAYPKQLQFVLQQLFKQHDVEMHSHCNIMLVHGNLGHVAVQILLVL